MPNKKRKSTLQKSAELRRAKAEEIAREKMACSASSSPMTPKETQKMLLELQVHQIELEMQNEELQRAQTELDELKDRYFELYNMAPVGYFTLCEKGLIIEANLTAATLLGMSRSALSGQPLSRFILKEDQDTYYLFRKKLSEPDSPQLCELRMLSDKGIEFWADITATVAQDTKENPICRLVLNDVSERKRMEEEISLKDKMMIVQSRQAAMGEMISMIAHQWRQPLNVVGLAIANIETKQMLELLDQETLSENLSIIGKSVTYMSETIDDFRSFFKPDKPKEIIHMEDVVANTIDIMGKGLENHNIDVRIQNSSKSALFISKSSLIQVLVNILGNAKDILVTKEIQDPQIRISISETGEAVVTKICDNAGGIPDSVMERMGQPYFTTKELNGTGLGLYMSKIVVEKHLSGTLSWHNGEKGACFVISLKRESTQE